MQHEDDVDDDDDDDARQRDEEVNGVYISDDDVMDVDYASSSFLEFSSLCVPRCTLTYRQRDGERECVCMVSCLSLSIRSSVRQSEERERERDHDESTELNDGMLRMVGFKRSRSSSEHRVNSLDDSEADATRDWALDPIDGEALEESHGAFSGHEVPHGRGNGSRSWTRFRGDLHPSSDCIERIRHPLSDETCCTAADEFLHHGRGALLSSSKSRGRLAKHFIHHPNCPAGRRSRGNAFIHRRRWDVHDTSHTHIHR